jgi:hypothetical protein
MSYPGGKLGAGVYHAIINQIPPHRLYVEPFVGGGAILLKKRPAEQSIAYDLDQAAILRLSEAVPLASDLFVKSRLLVGDGVEVLAATRFERDTFIYCDPPYLQTAVLTRLRYEHILTTAQHARLLKAIKAQRCPVAISGYWSRLYAEELADWRHIRFPSMTRGGYPCEEWLWMNYPDPQITGQLHDYQYVGKNYREREKFRRQQKRWSTRLAKMTALQRMALMSVLEETPVEKSCGDPKR